jgi:hypothetical protein
MTEAEPDETFSQEVFDDSDIVVEVDMKLMESSTGIKLGV